MHDVHRDAILHTGKGVKKSGRRQEHEDHPRQGNHAHGHDQHDARGVHAHEHEAHQDDDHRYDNPHERNLSPEQHGHDHDIPHGHRHEHDDAAFEEHAGDLHAHGHDREENEDRAFTHVHDHGHNFYHGHFHSHHPEHTTVMHRVFGNPARDWFAAGLMGVLIAAGYFKMLPGHLSDGMLVCAAVIGLFPLLKNAVFNCIAKRALSADLIFGALLLGWLIAGYFFAVAVMSLCLLAGSFLRLDFSWKKE